VIAVGDLSYDERSHVPEWTPAVRPAPWLTTRRERVSLAEWERLRTAQQRRTERQRAAERRGGAR
jgi:hypothetical protein